MPVEGQAFFMDGEVGRQILFSEKRRHGMEADYPYPEEELLHVATARRFIPLSGGARDGMS